MGADGLRLEHGRRVLLARHPVAIECARIAAEITRAATEIVVFEADRAYVVAASEVDIFQPRLISEAESRLLSGNEGAAVAGDGTAIAIRDSAGLIIGALTLHGVGELTQADALHALARLVSGILSEAERRQPSPLTDQLDPIAILDGLRDAVIVLDEELRVAWANRAVGSLLGRTATDIMGRLAADLLHPDDIETALDGISRLRDGREIYRVVVRIERGDGGYERVGVTGVDQSTNPAVNGLVLSFRTAEVVHELEASVERVRRMADAIVARLHDGIVATDQFGALTTVNAAARAMFGFDVDAPAAELSLDELGFYDTVGRPLSGDRHPTRGADDDEPREVCVISPRGDLRYLKTIRRTVLGSEGVLLGTVVSFHDVTAARAAEEELRNQALHDHLTGLPNRRQLEVRLTSLSGLDPPTNVAACFFDFDNFKLVNDTHGHRLGDGLIRAAAERLESLMRDDDLLVRHGGDMFVALLVDVADTDEAVAAAERLRHALSQPYTVGSHRLDLTMSAGVAATTTADLMEDTLLRHADIALYAAKARGRNRVELFDVDLAEAVELQERQRRMLRHAIDNRRIVMHYQPLVDPDTSETRGYEALARCPDENGDLVGPAAFMDTLSHSGLMWDLDRTAFELACQAAAILARRAPSEPPIVACNFSPVSLAEPELVAFITETAAIKGVDPSQICIEITESSAFDSGPSGLAALGSLHDRGFLLALDDFGTGYSSLAHLRDLPLSSVKVDRSFIAKLTHDTSERAIAEAIVNLANDLGLGVIAEGVETPEQLEQARRLGFTLIQGWHISPALALPEVLATWAPWDASAVPIAD